MMSFCRLLSTRLIEYPLPRLSSYWVAMDRRRPQMSSLMCQSLDFASSKRKLSSITTQDIKRKVLKNLNVNRNEFTGSGKEIVIYESTRHDHFRTIAVVGLFSYILFVFIFNLGVFWFGSQLEPDEQNQVRPGILGVIYGFLNSRDSMLKLSILFLFCGHLVLCASVLFCVRTVNYISLVPSASGADKVRIYCYSVFGLPNVYHKHEVAVNRISALTHRLDSKSGYVLFKVKGELLKYRIDRRGNFVQPAIFDETVGVKRIL